MEKLIVDEILNLNTFLRWECVGVAGMWMYITTVFCMNKVRGTVEVIMK